jgi:hypothetical protein
LQQEEGFMLDDSSRQGFTMAPFFETEIPSTAIQFVAT